MTAGARRMVNEAVNLDNLPSVGDRRDSSSIPAATEPIQIRLESSVAAAPNTEDTTAAADASVQDTTAATTDPSDTVASIVTVTTTPATEAPREATAEPPTAAAGSSPVSNSAVAPADAGSSSSTATASAASSLPEMSYERLIISILESNLSQPELEEHQQAEALVATDYSNDAASAPPAPVAAAVVSSEPMVGLASLAAVTATNTMEAATLELLSTSTPAEGAAAAAVAVAAPEAMSVSPQRSPPPPMAPSVVAPSSGLVETLYPLTLLI